MPNQYDLLTLDDDKDYLVVFSTELNFKKYFYLIDQDDYTNTMFCEYTDNKLKEETEPTILEQLITQYQSRLSW